MPFVIDQGVNAAAMRFASVFVLAPIGSFQLIVNVVTTRVHTLETQPYNYTPIHLHTHIAIHPHSHTPIVPSIRRMALQPHSHTATQPYSHIAVRPYGHTTVPL